MTTYDYDRQCWIEGRPAAVLRVRHLAEELELLTDPEAGAAYAENIGCRNPHTRVSEMTTEAQDLIREHSIDLREITAA